MVSCLYKGIISAFTLNTLATVSLNSELALSIAYKGSSSPFS